MNYKKYHLQHIQNGIKKTQIPLDDSEKYLGMSRPWKVHFEKENEKKIK